MIRGTQAGYETLSDFAERARPVDWTRTEVLQEMNRILSSPMFAKSVRLSRFLRVAVEYLVEGKSELLKEYTVGTEVYERGAAYDPTHDTIVRTEARRLRSKLNEFYSCDHYPGAVTIGFVAGSYVPVITPRDRTRALPELPIGDSLKQVRVAVTLFRASGTDGAVQRVAGDLTDEMTYRLSQRSGLRVFRSSSDRDSDSSAQLRTWRDSGVNAVLYGSVRSCGAGITTTVHLADPSGMILWSQRFELPPPGDAFTNLHDDFVDTIVNRLEDPARGFPTAPTGLPI